MRREKSDGGRFCSKKKKTNMGSSLGWAGSSPIEAAIFATLFGLPSSPTPAPTTGLPPPKKHKLTLLSFNSKTSRNSEDGQV